MSYVVLARKWRPQQFSDVLGQEHVTRTLGNAIRAQRIAHAFLFSGPRGVGKTSAARILAKALCCAASDGPTAEPCGVCRQCAEITEGRSTDIFEIDAASHTGVDNVREIIDNVRYLPSSARFKIYVIDEVHMLSTGAFNALLKTLEEPPAHVKFILATTDVHKVPVTILSRCQRYDFRRIPLGAVGERLSQILSSEGVEHDPSALTLVAREGEGSMRDAQSLLEQVLAFAGGRRLDGALVREALGVVDHALIERTFTSILGRQPGALMELVGEVYARGLDLNRFADALIEHARDLLMARIVDDPGASLDRPKDEIESMVRLARQHEPAAFERIFEQLCRIAEDVGRSSHPRFALEIGLAGLAEAPPHVPLEALLEQLARMEALLAGGAPPPRSGGAPPRDSGGQRFQGGGARGPQAAPPGGAGSRFQAQAEPRPSQPASERPAPLAAEPGPASASRGPDHPPDRGFERGSGGPTRAPDVTAAPSRPAGRGIEQAGGAQRGGPALGGTGPRGAPDFAAFVHFVKSRRAPLAAPLVQVRPLAFDPGRVELGCETQFDETRLSDRDTRGELEALLGEFFGVPTTLGVTRVRRGEGGAPPMDAPRTLVEAAEEARSARVVEKEQSARQHPAVKAIAEELGGAIAKVRVLDEGG